MIQLDIKDLVVSMFSTYLKNYVSQKKQKKIVLFFIDIVVFIFILLFSRRISLAFSFGDAFDIFVSVTIIVVVFAFLISSFVFIRKTNKDIAKAEEILSGDIIEYIATHKDSISNKQMYNTAKTIYSEKNNAADNASLSPSRENEKENSSEDLPKEKSKEGAKMSTTHD